MDLDALKQEYRHLTDPTADWHHTDADLERVRAQIADADPSWLADYDVKLAAWEADVENS